MADDPKRTARRMIAGLDRGEKMKLPHSNRVFQHQVERLVLKERPDTGVRWGDDNGVPAYVPGVASAGTNVYFEPPERQPYTGGAAIP